MEITEINPKNITVKLSNSNTLRMQCTAEESSQIIEFNRDLFLSELRSGKYKKGTTKSDERGYPVFEKSGDEDGYCACAIMLHLFDPGSVTSMKRSREALGLTVKECTFIQQEINDSDLGFDEIANRIEKEVFKR